MLFIIVSIIGQSKESASNEALEFKKNGAGEGSRTLVASLGSWCITVMLHPQDAYTVLVFLQSSNEDSRFFQFFYKNPSRTGFPHRRMMGFCFIFPVCTVEKTDF